MNTLPNRSEWTGRVIDGRFTLLQWLGGSEGSDVFLTELPKDPSQKAAIKLIPAEDRDTEARIAGWAATTTLSHPHLMRLLHTGSCEIGAARLLYAVTEYAEEVLSQILPERPLTLSETREMLDPVLDALAYLYEKGFVHGHLKPSNIMVVGDRLKLSCDSLHRAGEMVKHASPPGIYDAPESAAGPISTAADSWSLGITLVEALTQHPPVWERSTDTEPVVPESIPQPFAGIARESLRRDPARRCSLSDVKARLASARFFPVPDSKTGKAASAKLRVTATIAAVLVLFAVVTALLLQSRQTQPPPPTEEKMPAPASAAAPPQSLVPRTPRPKAAPAKDGVIEQVMPDVPQKALDTIRGKIAVSIRITVDPSGVVSDAAFDSPGASQYFAKRALQAARHWKFKPAQVDGQAVTSVWLLRFQFTQTGTEVTPVIASP
jgi:TonB family protein